ncbi:cyclophilin-like family protein [Streptomyces inhibens]|uniref:cyclophilin-like family protein n=1 Tax=Streptomyces inhibens TaxID=2293571 RepID=UPI001C6F075F
MKIRISWPAGQLTRGEESRLASPCNALGRIDGDPRALATVRSGDPIHVRKA